jgi:RNA-binding protein YlmH
MTQVTLNYTSLEESEAKLTQEQLVAINQARFSLKNNGGKTNKEVMDKLKTKYPNAFYKPNKKKLK